MQILYHSDALASPAQFGLARYARELYAAIERSRPAFDLEPFSSRTAPGAGFASGGGYREVRHPGWPHRTLVLLWTMLNSPRIERFLPKADVVHTLELDYPVATARPWVVTVHDVGPLTHPEYFSKSRRWLRRRGLEQAARRADVVIAVSSATADAVEGLVGNGIAKRIRVVPEAVSAQFFEPAAAGALVNVPDLPPAGEPYFMWAGSMNPRKNLPNVVAAFERIAGGVPHRLVLVGGLAWDSDETLKRLADSPVAHRVHRPGFVSDAALRALYQRADAFVYVSLLEGFGLPILEAMASGCPVITSDRSSMPEVAGDAAALVDPRSVDAIADAMLALATDAELAGQLRRRGRERAAGFRWPRVAGTVCDAYTGLTGKPS